MLMSGALPATAQPTVTPLTPEQDLILEAISEGIAEDIQTRDDLKAVRFVCRKKKTKSKLIRDVAATYSNLSSADRKVIGGQSGYSRIVTKAINDLCKSVNRCKQADSAVWTTDSTAYVALRLRNTKPGVTYSRSVVRLVGSDGKTVHGSTTVTGIINSRSSRYLTAAIDLTPQGAADLRLEAVTVCATHRSKSRVIPASIEPAIGESCSITGTQSCGNLLFDVPTGWEVPSYSTVHMPIFDATGVLIGGCRTTTSEAMTGGFITPIEYLGWSCPSTESLPTGWRAEATTYIEK